jgi:glucokinase
MAERLIGVDVGGTKVSVSVLEGTDLADPVLHRTETASTAALLDQLEAVVREQGDAAGVGIAVPSVIDFATGLVRFSVNIPLEGVRLREELADRLGCPVFVDNDATAAALAEAHDDELQPIAASLVLFTVGTGVGGGLVLGGRVYRGATGAAAELGHILIAADVADGAPAATSDWPHRASLERHAAGTALDRLAEERGLPKGPELVKAAQDGDPGALDCLRILGERLGIGIANAVNTFDPDLVVIGGGVSAAGDLLLEPARESAARFVLPGVGTRTRIELARYGPRAGVRGAALLARQELGEQPATGLAPGVAEHGGSLQ